MTTRFGWCIDAPGATHSYCSQCPREFTDQWGIRHVCSCVNHELDDQKEED